MKNKDLQWFVYIEINNEIKEYNIFDNIGFKNDILKLDKDSDDFNVLVKRWLKYWFSHHSQWEILVCDLFKTVSEKINVCDQVSINFDKFIDYLKKVL